MSKETLDVCGFILIKEDGNIVAVEHHGTVVRLGQTVRSNGRFWAISGTPGTVVAINTPYEGRTSDILEIQFEGYPGPVSMKFKDLEFSEGPGGAPDIFNGGEPAGANGI